MYKVTLLKDIALQANCSINTVSLALKDSRRISEKTRKQIQGLAKELNYVSNNMARALVLNKTGSVGLIIRNISSLLLTSEAQYIEQHLEQRGYTMYMAASHDDPEKEKKLIDLMLSNRMDGIIVNTILTNNIPRLEELKKDGFPIVLISGFVNDPAIDSIYPDLVHGAYTATRHLLSIGHKRVIYMTGVSWRHIKDDLKFIGYQKAIEDENVPFSENLVCSLKLYNSHNVEDRDIPKLISIAKKETACFVSEDELAIPVIKLLEKNGVHVPDDLAITSIDNIRFAESCVVSLTTVGFDLQYISNRAVDMLTDRIEGRLENQEKPQHIKAEPVFFMRESCGYLGAAGNKPVYTNNPEYKGVSMG
jgi:DNA-binding LacI/PurR family transcriptional regulator